MIPILQTRKLRHRKMEFLPHLSVSAPNIMNGKPYSVPNALIICDRHETALLQMVKSWEMPARRETDGTCAGTPHILPAAQVSPAQLLLGK